MTRDDISVRDAADILGIEGPLLARLCRYLGSDAAATRIPRHVIDHVALQPVEDRYPTVRSWLLNDIDMS